MWFLVNTFAAHKFNFGDIMKNSIEKNNPRSLLHKLFVRCLPCLYIGSFCCAGYAQESTRNGKWNRNDSLDVTSVFRSPFMSAQQGLKGNIPGLYVQENNGEPGTIQSMLIRGLSSPVFSNRDVSGVQPAVYLNGIPLLTDNSFIYDIKSNDVNPMGTATNLLAGLDINQIVSIEVVKDPARLAQLGPLAANGAIMIRTKDGYYGGKNFSVNASAGMVMPTGSIRMTNAADEKQFRLGFANACTTPAQKAAYLLRMPNYLQNTSSDYFAEPEWTDNYFKNAPLYNVGVSIGGGRPEANYMAMAGYTSTSGVSDDTGLNRFNAGFGLNMVPLKGLTVSALLNATRMDRYRNRNFLDRYAEMEYLPDLSTPVSPLGGYAYFLAVNDDYTQDENLTNLLNGFLGATYKGKNLHADIRLLLDYNSNMRHVFWPSVLTDGASYTSDFSGYNRRIMGKASVGYDLFFGKSHVLKAVWNGSLSQDLQHYIYTRGYEGTDDTKPNLSGGGFSKNNINRYADEIDARLISNAFMLDYYYKNILKLGVLLREDGTTKVQSDHRWLFSPAFSAGLNFRNMFAKKSKVLTDLSLNASWARIGKIFETDRYAAGPQYVGEGMSWRGQSAISSMNGYGTITRPYNTGWVGYGIGWPYSDKFNVDLTLSLWKRFSATLAYYNNTDKDMVAATPVPQEFGYQYQYEQGMDINNRGVELTLHGQLLHSRKGLNWEASVHAATNKNELKKLPGGYTELVVGDRLLKVGEFIDRFWVYQNEGVYNSQAETLVKGQPLMMDGVAFDKGDARWTNINGDNVIDESDKVLKGHSLPSLTGGFSSKFTYKRWDLAFHLFFAYGQDVLNYRVSQQYDFMRLDNTRSLAAVKEIFYWQDTYMNKNYPLYNPMSQIPSYRYDQDLFLEDASYLKLRTLTLGYNMPLKARDKKKAPESLYFYLTANNLFTLSDFKDGDPEAAGFNGVYSGYAQRIPLSVQLGLKFNF